MLKLWKPTKSIVIGRQHRKPNTSKSKKKHSKELKNCWRSEEYYEHASIIEHSLRFDNWKTEKLKTQLQMDQHSETWKPAPQWLTKKITFTMSTKLWFFSLTILIPSHTGDCNSIIHFFTLGLLYWWMLSWHMIWVECCVYVFLFWIVSVYLLLI